MFRNVVKKADLRSYEFILSKEMIDSDGLASMLDKVTSEGVHWERILGGCLYIYLPLNSDYDPEKEINRLNDNLEKQ